MAKVNSRNLNSTAAVHSKAVLGSYTKRTTCRTCGSQDLVKFISLGPTPLANSFLKKDQLSQEEYYYPLDMYFCKDCCLVQLLDIVSPQIMFKNYLYTTGTSEPLKRHFDELAHDIVDSFKLSDANIVMDIGSNDGTLLERVSRYGPRILGVEPASNIANISIKKGIPTFNDFFDINLSLRIKEEFGEIDAITATNVFAHVDDLNGFLKGVDNLLSEKGVLVIEVPYLLNLLNSTEFDTVYHEHLSYFALKPLEHLFSSHGMKIVNVKQIPVHGGSLRVFVRRSGVNSSPSVGAMLLSEQNSNLSSIDTYFRFADRVREFRNNLLALLKRLKEDGKRITGYGATAKGNTLLNYCGIGVDILDFISDTTELKQGRYTPGMHIPVVSESVFHEYPPDYALLLAWNYAEDILKKEKDYRTKGGQFIVPLPEIHIA